MNEPCDLYVLELEDKSEYGFYVGVTCNPIRRWQQHITENGAKITERYKAKDIILCKGFETREDTLRRESVLWELIKSGNFNRDDLPASPIDCNSMMELVNADLKEREVRRRGTIKRKRKERIDQWLTFREPSPVWREHLN